MDRLVNCDTIDSIFLTSSSLVLKSPFWVKQVSSRSHLESKVCIETWKRKPCALNLSQKPSQNIQSRTFALTQHATECSTKWRSRRNVSIRWFFLLLFLLLLYSHSFSPSVDDAIFHTKTTTVQFNTTVILF